MKIRFTTMGRAGCWLGTAALLLACCTIPAQAADRVVLGEEFTNVS